MKPTFLGFTTQPFAIVEWDGKYKTYCFSESELQSTLERYNTPGDFYFNMPHNIRYYNKAVIPA